MPAELDFKNLKLKLDGMVPSGSGFHRNLLFDALYTSLPRDPQVKVQIYNAEIVPGGYTNWHCHNGAAFFVALQGQFEAHFQEGVLVKAKAGDCYSEPIAKFHRGILVTRNVREFTRVEGLLVENWWDDQENLA